MPILKLIHFALCLTPQTARAQSKVYEVWHSGMYLCTFLEPERVTLVMFSFLSASVKSLLRGAPVISLMFLSPSASMARQCRAIETHDSSVRAQFERSRLSRQLPILLTTYTGSKTPLHTPYNLIILYIEYSHTKSTISSVTRATPHRDSLVREGVEVRSSSPMGDSIRPLASKLSNVLLALSMLTITSTCCAGTL